MNMVDLEKAWKSDAYRSTLTDAQLSALPANPVGIVELDEDELTNANGGATPSLAVYSFTVSAVASVVASFAGCTGD